MDSNPHTDGRVAKRAYSPKQIQCGYAAPPGTGSNSVNGQGHDCFGAQIDMRQVYLTVGGGWGQWRERPSLDIDLRAMRTAYRQSGGIDVRLGSKSTVSASIERSKVPE